MKHIISIERAFFCVFKLKHTSIILHFDKAPIIDFFKLSVYNYIRIKVFFLTEGHL